MDAAPQSFEQYRQNLLLVQARWASGIAAVITPLGGLFREADSASARELLWVRLGLGALFALVLASTYLRRRSSMTGIWQTLAVTVIGASGATLIGLSSGEWSLRQQGAMNIIVLACGLLFPWRLREMAPACLLLMGLFVLPPLLSHRPEDFSLRVYLLGVTAVIASVGAHRSVSLRRKEFEARRSLEERGADLAETSRQLHESVTRLRDLDRQKNAFFANISHELRTPLTLLASPLELLRSLPAGAVAPEVSWQLEVMQRNVNVLLRHISGLLELVRLDEGRLQLQRATVEVGPFVEGVVARFAPHARARGIRVAVSLARELPPLWADEKQLDTVLSNLLSNAFKFTERGGSVSVLSMQVGDAVELVVADDGRGIPEHEQARIFERFVQGEGASGHGLGIGLSLVREIVQLHAGVVSVESAPGRGATFRVRLPVDASSASTAGGREAPALPAPEPLPRPPPEPSARALGERLLVVEDEEDLRHFLQLCLRDRFEVILASSGEEGLALAASSNVDVVICDLRLPDMTGLELTRRLRGQPALSDLPVILMTAFETPEVRVEGLRHGAVDFLGKPFSPAELTARVEVQLRQRRLAAESARIQKLTMLHTLLEGLAHEVRNPLNVIANIAPLMRKQLGDSPSGSQLVDLLDEASTRIGSLLDELTALSRGDGSLPRDEEWSPRESVDSILRLLESRCERVEINRELRFSGTVRGRSVQLDQIVMNLLDNALRAMPQGGELTVRAEAKDSQLCLTVADTGVGISPEHLSRVFDPFFTTRETGEGSGLGLHINRRIAESHGGVIDVVSESGKGARFTLRLPLTARELAG